MAPPVVRAQCYRKFYPTPSAVPLQRFCRLEKTKIVRVYGNKVTEAVSCLGLSEFQPTPLPLEISAFGSLTRCDCETTTDARRWLVCSGPPGFELPAMAGVGSKDPKGWGVVTCWAGWLYQRRGIAWC